MTTGRFVTLEGVEGVGKSTQIDHIARYLENRGHMVRITREPGGTVLGERIRELLLGEQTAPLSADAETLLMFAARAQHLDEVIRPALLRGEWVICDRFTDATRAYQGAGRGVNDQLLDCLIRTVQRGLQPDLTLLLDAPAELGLARIGHRPMDRFEQEGVAFLERVRQAYLRLAALEPDRIRCIDAARPPEQIQHDITVCLDNLLTDAGVTAP